MSNCMSAKAPESKRESVPDDGENLTESSGIQKTNRLYSFEQLLKFCNTPTTSGHVTQKKKGEPKNKTKILQVKGRSDVHSDWKTKTLPVGKDSDKIDINAYMVSEQVSQIQRDFDLLWDRLYTPTTASSNPISAELLDSNKENVPDGDEKSAGNKECNSSEQRYKFPSTPKTLIDRTTSRNSDKIDICEFLALCTPNTTTADRQKGFSDLLDKLFSLNTGSKGQDNTLNQSQDTQTLSVESKERQNNHFDNSKQTLSMTPTTDTRYQDNTLNQSQDTQTLSVQSRERQKTNEFDSSEQTLSITPNIDTKCPDTTQNPSQDTQTMSVESRERQKTNKFDSSEQIFYNTPNTDTTQNQTLSTDSREIHKSNQFNTSEQMSNLSTSGNKENKAKNTVLTDIFSDWDDLLTPPVGASQSLAAEFKKRDTTTTKNNGKNNICEFMDIMCTPTTNPAQRQKEFSDLLDKLCTPNQISTQNHSQDTQTDNFDDNLKLVQMQQFAHRHKELKEATTQTSFELAPVTKVHSAKVPNILSILSQNINIMPDGFSLYNNIDKIGTEKWLESALTAIDKFVYNRKTMKPVDIVETQNTSSMYVDNKMKIDLKRVRQGEEVICEISKIARNKRNRSMSFETQESVSNSEKLSRFETKLRSSIDEICKNKDLINDHFNTRVIDKSKISHKIHDILSKVYEALESNEVPVLLIRNREKRSNSIFKDGRFKCAPLKDAPLKKIRFKKTTFPRTLYLLGKIYTLIGNKSKVTKRELYYQTKRLVKRQGAMDDCLHEITCMLGIGHWHLNITASSGLVFGNLMFVWASGETMNCNVQATSIPYDLEDIVEVHCTAHFILVLEKESIFRKLIEEELPKKLTRPFIMITGKGVPDINTRLFLNRISTMMGLPVFIVCDADIYGIKIMLAYRFGVVINCHLSDDLAVPNARWLGVLPSEIVKYGLRYQTLNARDRKVIDEVMAYPCLDEHPRIIEEIQVLANSNRKASIESLIKTDMFLSHTYIPTKFIDKDFI